ncbi:MAG: epoxyqueuosine reductase [Candidatus Hodarchaeales archaeon]|jgi:epoxyqueuosine reductase QueG
MISDIENPAVWIRTIIKKYINESSENTLKNRINERAWNEPLIEFSNGTDPLYEFFKDDIGDFYLLPEELFAQRFPNAKFVPAQLTVISWILPQTAATKTEHRTRTKFPTESWARARIFGEEVNDKLRKHVVEKLNEKGYKALAPLASPLWQTTTSDKYSFASTWSERHAAYAAGLGTFGLCDGLITPKGKAMRCGSVIAKIAIPPSDRPYDNFRAYCLFYKNGTCGECIDRCPAGALSESGHDKVKCLNYLNKTREFVREHFKFEGYGCGLCQTGVPCESSIPD